MRELFLNSAYKPGSVVNGHLSLPCVAARLQGFRLVPPANIRRANKFAYGVASDKVYSKSTLP